MLMLPATALCVFAFGASPAAADTSLPNTNLSCNDGTNLNLALDTASLTDLTNAVSAMALVPAGDPALACGLSAPSASSGDPNGPKDFAVGGGQFMSIGSPPNLTCGLANFALSAHVDADAPVAPGQPGVGGTYNVSTGATSPCGEGHLVAKVDCVQVTGNQAMLTVQEEQAKGPPAFFGTPGQELALTVTDNTPDEITVEGGFFTSGPCDFSASRFFLEPITNGNITVHDA
jgi:hypothetical protein